MSIRYFDPSAWVKRYFLEDGSEAVNALFRIPETIACSRLGLIEMVATIARKCHRESLDNSITEKLLEDVKLDFAQFIVIPTEEAHVIAAAELAVRHRLRTMDALHLACALHLQTLDETIVVSADLELLAAAVQENLPTLNPCKKPN